MQRSHSRVAKAPFIGTLRGKQLTDSLIFANFETISKSCWCEGQNWSDGQTILFSAKHIVYLKHTTFLGRSEPIHDIAAWFTENDDLIIVNLGHSSYVSVRSQSPRIVSGGPFVTRFWKILKKCSKTRFLPALRTLADPNFKPLFWHFFWTLLNLFLKAIRASRLRAVV